MKPHHVLILIAALVLLGGGYAFFSAPPEANKVTAIAIPGFIAAVGLTFAALLARRVSRGVIAAAAVVLLFFSALVAFPAVMRTNKMTNFPAASEAWTKATTDDPTLAPRAAADRSVRKAFFAERNSPDHDQTYLVLTLWFLTGVCFMGALVLFFQRSGVAAKPLSTTPS